MLRRHSRAVRKLIPGCWYYALRGGATCLIWVMKTHLGNNRLVITMGREKCMGNRNREAPTKANINIRHERHENQGRERKEKLKKRERVEVHSLRSSSSVVSSIPFPPQHKTKGVRCSTTARHCTHFFIRLAQSAGVHTNANTHKAQG